jgi:nicotinamidase-related amidase
MTADPGATAVVLIEFQHDFTSDGGALHGAVEEVMGPGSFVIPTAAHLLKAEA